MTINTQDRRLADETSARLRALLNEDQRMALADLERFGWSLKFVRKPLFKPSIPVVFDGERKRYAVLEPDGSLNEEPGFDIRS
ncbi:MAG: hypothetical protein JWL98_675 [Xanthomonadaceae bacterium]|nr:hypothetical protein [Xanthomonadaceae bacterium]